MLAIHIMYSKRASIIVLVLTLALLFPLCVDAIECHDLATQSDFTELDNGETVILCSKAYTEEVTISNIPTKFILDCDGASVPKITAEDSVRIVMRNCITSATYTNVIQGTISGNTFKNEDVGLSLQLSKSIAINTNEFTNNQIGLKLLQSNSNTITLENEFTNNGLGLLLDSSSENKIYKNVLEKSLGSDAILARTSGQSNNNVWFIGEEGNYWSDYSGEGTYEINSEIGINIDEFPFANRDFSTEIAPGEIKELTEQVGEFTLNIGDGVKFSCGEASYTVTLMSTTPQIDVDINQDAATLQSFKSNIFDLDYDGIDDVNIMVTGHALENIDVKITRLATCANVCGDGFCSIGEVCEIDCKADLDADEDADGYSLAAGDCDDNDRNIYPDAKEKCGTIDYDCDGFIGEEDTDCQGMGAAFWFLLVIGLLLAGAAGFFYFQKKKPTFTPSAPTPAPKAEKPTGPDPKIKKIMDYADNYFEKGYARSQIREILLSQGWESNDIASAFRALTKQGSGLPKPAKPSVIARLRKQVSADLAAGKKRTEIRETLRKKGWADRIINLVFKGA